MLTEDIEDDRGFSLTHNILSAACDFSAMVAVREVPQCQHRLQVNCVHLDEEKWDKILGVSFNMMIIIKTIYPETLKILTPLQQYFKVHYVG